MENLLKSKIDHQTRLDQIEADLTVRLRAIKADLTMNETKEEKIKTLDNHIKHLYETRMFISNICEAYLDLLNESVKNISEYD